MGMNTRTYTLSNGKTITLTISKRLNKLAKRNLFPKKVAEAEHMLSTSILPEL